MKHEKFELSSGATMRQPRLVTLGQKLDSLRRQRESIDAQILQCEQAIRRQLEMGERQIVSKEGVWWEVAVESRAEESINPTLARTLLPARIISKLLKKTHRVKIRVTQVPAERAKKLKSQLARTSPSSN